MNWDWSPVATALNSRIQQYGQEQQYKQLLQGLLGSDGTAQSPAQLIAQQQAPQQPQQIDPLNKDMPAAPPIPQAPSPTAAPPSGSALSGLSPQLAQLFKILPPQIGMPLLMQVIGDKLLPKAHTFSSTRDGQVYDTSTGQMIGTSVKDRDTAAANAANQVEAQTIAGTNATGNIGSLDSLPLESGNREALRSLVQSGGAKGLDTYRDVVKSQADQKNGGITTRNVDVGDQTKIGQFQNGQLVGFAKDQSGKEITAPRYKPAAAAAANPASDPVVQGYVQNILSGNGTLQNVPTANGRRDAVSTALAGALGMSPLAGQRRATEANKITAPMRASSTYQLATNSSAFVARADAALAQPPSSVADQDILDSLTKMNQGAGAITDAQVRIITDGKSWSDTVGVWANKLKNGGVLSDFQRQQAVKLIHAEHNSYQNNYRQLYDARAADLQKAGIPKEFWGIPEPLDAAAPAPSASGASGWGNFRVGK